MRTVLIVASLVLCVTAAPYDPKVCVSELQRAGVSQRFNETVAHAIHSMTVQGLRLFNPRATVKNKAGRDYSLGFSISHVTFPEVTSVWGVPTVNHNLQSDVKVLPYAPDDPVDSDFATLSMNVIDKILSTLGQPNDGLGPNWSAIERVVHQFHMMDLWTRVLHLFPAVTKAPPSQAACDCLLDTTSNGIKDAVQWVADHYVTGTPITLLNRPIPKLHDAQSWGVWRERLLHYYDVNSLRDAATYIYCVTKDM